MFRSTRSFVTEIMFADTNEDTNNKFYLGTLPFMILMTFGEPHASTPRIKTEQI